MERKPELYDRLMEYQKNGRYPFHMPGHKRRFEEICGGNFPNPFSVDITEIEGFDNLHHPEGILKDSMEWASSVYGTKKTYYLVNGSSSGVMAAVCAAAAPDGRILMGRNAHKSNYHAVFLNRLKTTYIYPQNSDKYGIQCGLLSKTADRLLTNHSETEAMVITSPTYDGIVSDVAALADIAHRHGVLLIVDEAHGAHFPFGGHGTWFPKSALECGADVVLQSVHKTLPSLTQTALLHVNSNRIDTERLEYYLQIFQSSSPSYVLMASIEQCIRMMTETGEERIAAYMSGLRDIRAELGEMKCLKLVGKDLVGESGVYDVDESKVVISCRGCLGNEGGGVYPLTGERLASILRERYYIEPEMCGAEYVVLLSTFLDTKEGLNRMKEALLQIDAELVCGSAQRMEPIPEAEEVCGIADAMAAERESVKLEASAGRTAAEFVYLYPPGIPIVAPGERLSAPIVERILKYREMGLPVQGPGDKTIQKIMCVK